MNAMTAADFTMYPFSTQNAADYHNLLAVYLDATFFPLLREIDFQQEGHRVEFQDAARQTLLPAPILPNFPVLARACLWCLGAPIWVLTSPRA